MGVRHLHSLFLLFGTAACVAPLSNHPSGRSVGEGKDLIGASLTLAQTEDGDRLVIPDFRFLHGTTEDLDLGVEAIFPSVAGGTLRYSLINPEQDGFAWAVHGGLGVTPLMPFFAYYTSAGTTVSYRRGSWEPFATLRANSTRVNFSSSDTDGFWLPDDGDFEEDYTSVSAGLAWWSSEGWGLYGQVSFISGVTAAASGLEDSALLSFGFALEVGDD